MRSPESSRSANGVTNVALALVGAALVYGLARAFSLPWGAAAFAGSLWLLNFHGINMAVLWISGRTALLLTRRALEDALIQRDMVELEG